MKRTPLPLSASAIRLQQDDTMASSIETTCRIYDLLCVGGEKGQLPNSRVPLWPWRACHSRMAMPGTEAFEGRTAH